MVGLKATSESQNRLDGIYVMGTGSIKGEREEKEDEAGDKFKEDKVPSLSPSLLLHTQRHVLLTSRITSYVMRLCLETNNVKI